MRQPAFNLLRRASLVLGVLGFAALLPLPVQADEDLPTAREVIDRYLEAIGGADALAGRESLSSSGEFAIPAQGMTGAVTVLAKAPDKFLLTVEIAGVGQVRQGYDGEVAWSMDPMTGPQILEGKSADQARDQANFYSSLYRDEDLETLEMVGKTEFGESTVYELHVVTKNGIESNQYFDVESGLMIGSKGKQYSPMGEIPTTTRIKDYRDVDGLKLPGTIEQTMMGMTQAITMSEMSFEEIGDETFALPEEIQALLEPAAAETP